MTIHKFLKDGFHNPLSTPARIINGFIFFVIIFSVAILPLIVLKRFYPNLENPLAIAEKIIVTIFLIEYGLRVFSEKNPFRFIFSWNSLIDILAIAPFFLEQIINSPYIWVFTLLRILRLFKFLKIMEFEQSIIADPTVNPCKKVLRIEGEKILKIVYKHPLFFLANLLSPIAFLSISFFVIVIGNGQLWSLIATALLIILIGILFFKLWLDFNYDFLLITSERVIIQDYQIFGATANAMPYSGIVNIIEDNRGFWNWIIRSGKIRIETAGAQKVIMFNNVREPKEVAQTINQYRAIYKRKHRIK